MSPNRPDALPWAQADPFVAQPPAAETAAAPASKLRTWTIQLKRGPGEEIGMQVRGADSVW